MDPDCQGILTRPAAEVTHRLPRILILSGGAQTRVGAHRQWVLTARHLACQGHPVMRFDWHGLGDAAGQVQSFEAHAAAVHQALHAFTALTPDAQGTVLLGLCDGASSALLSLPAPAGCTIDGLALINPWVRSEAGLARAQLRHYYRQRWRDPAFWRKLLSGGVRAGAMLEWLGKWSHARRTHADPSSFQDRMAKAWHAFEGPVLLLTSELDITGQEFLTHAEQDPAWRGALQRPRLSATVVPQADHTCSSPAAHRHMLDALSTWLHANFGASSPP